MLSLESSLLFTPSEIYLRKAISFQSPHMPHASMLFIVFLLIIYLEKYKI